MGYLHPGVDDLLLKKLLNKGKGAISKYIKPCMGRVFIQILLIQRHRNRQSCLIYSERCLNVGNVLEIHVLLMHMSL